MLPRYFLAPGLTSFPPVSLLFSFETAQLGRNSVARLQRPFRGCFPATLGSGFFLEGGKSKTHRHTIKGAVSIATEGDVIHVSAGVYNENNPIVLPDDKRSNTSLSS